MRELLFLDPVLKECIWGGTRLSGFGYRLPSDRVGECWGISAHPNGDCTVRSGTFAGMSLSELFLKHRELFGGIEGMRFPLLVKLIDAKNDLSVQVHPDDEYARIHENGACGKAECWYILDGGENATVVLGHRARDRKEAEEMIRQGRFSEFIREIPIKKGDFLMIDPGVVHAIKGGTLLLETQENSDITYRVYDYGRLMNGAPRKLHIEESLAVMQCPCVPDKPDFQTERIGRTEIRHFVADSHFSTSLYRVDGELTVTNRNPFSAVTVLDGSGTVDGTPVKKGDNFLIPAGYGDFVLSGQTELMLSTVPKESAVAKS